MMTSCQECSTAWITGGKPTCQCGFEADDVKASDPIDIMKLCKNPDPIQVVITIL